MTLAPMKMRNFRDTIKACAKSGDNQFQYLKGHAKGHFPVPAVRIVTNIYGDAVEIMKDDIEQDFPFDTLIKYWDYRGNRL